MKTKPVTRLLCLLLSLTLLMGSFSVTVLAAAQAESESEGTERTDAFPAIQSAFDEEHKVFSSTWVDEVDEAGLTEWGYCGFEVKLSTYVKNKDLSAVEDGDVVIVYVINTNTERVGTDSDVSIISDLLERGFIVTVADYQNDERAVSPALDWSLQSIRRALLDDATMTAYLCEELLPVHKERSFALPAGYNIETDVVYFNFAENSVSGTTDHIVDIWNGDWGNNSSQDFLSDNGNKVIPWGQKILADGTPVYNDENGVRCVADGDGYRYIEEADGVAVGDLVADISTVVPEYKKVRDTAVWTDEAERTIAIKYTLAEDWWDCVKPDGSVIDMDLRMDIIYPTSPAEPVPVMGLSSSYETRSGDWLNMIRPHMTGFLFAGYAGAIWDHAYTPMARDDHYGYFQGDGAERNSFTLMSYTGIEAQTAAVRRLRYLADREPEKYCFDVDRFGAYGHSKGCYVYVLGHPDPLSLEEQELFSDNPTMELCGERPWTTYEDGTEISSGVQMIYGSSGSGYLWGTEGYAPMFTSQGVNDGAYAEASAYHNYNALAYQYDIPSLGFTMPGVGHTIIYGYNEELDTDMYASFFKFAHYWLKDAAAEVAYVTPISGTKSVDTNGDITVKFTGPVSEEQISKVTVTNLYDGSVASGSWESAFGNTTWHFTPDALEGGTLYYVYVPETVVAENGKPLASDFGVTFRTAYESTVEASTLSGTKLVTTESGEEGVYLVFDGQDFTLSTTTSLRIRINSDSINRIKVYAVTSYDSENVQNSTIGELLDTVSVYGVGTYDADISAYADALGTGAPVFYLAAEHAEASVTLASYDTDTSSYFGGDKLGYWIEEDNKCVMVSASTSLLGTLVVDRAYTEADLGRTFTISLRAYPTHEGNIAFYTGTEGENVEKTENDSFHYFAFETDENGDVIEKWYEFSYTYTVDEIDILHDKHTVRFAKFTNGVVYLDDIVITESFTDVSIGGGAIVLHNANRQSADSDAAVSISRGVDNVISEDADGLLVSGTDRDHTLGMQSKVYASLDLGGFSGQESVYLKLNVTDGTDAKLLVYGIANVRLAQSFDKENTSYLNAPANDRFSGGVNLVEMFGASPLATVTVTGEGQYLADITEYVHYMAACGAMYATVVIVSDGEGSDGEVTFTIPELATDATPVEGFESYEVGTNPLGAVRNGASGTEGNPTVTDAAAYLGEHSFSVLVNESYTRVYLSNTLTQMDFTEDDLGRSFTVTFYIKSDVESAIYLGLSSYKGANNDWNGGSAAKLHREISVTPNPDGWQKVTYTYTVDETMLKSTYESDTVTDGTGLAPTALTINGKNGTEKYVYIDELSVVENVESDRMSTVCEDFEEVDVGTTPLGAVRNGASGTDGNPTVTDAVSYSGERAFSVLVNESYTRVYLSNTLTPMDFTEDDLGRSFTVTFYIKSDVESSIYLGLSSYKGANNDWNGGSAAKLHQEISVTPNPDEWQKVTYTYTVDETMLKSTYESDTVTDGTGLAPTALTINGKNGTDKYIYIDDVCVCEVDPDAYAYIENFEDAAAFSDLGITVNGLGSWATKITLTDEHNHTPGSDSSKSMSVMSDSDSTRFYLPGLLDANNTLSADDVGATYRISFYIKAIKSGSFRLMLGSSTDDPTSALLDTTYKMDAASVGQWVRYEYSFTVTEEMVEGNDAYLIMRASKNFFCLDDLQSIRYEVGTSVALGSPENGAVTNGEVLDTLTVKNSGVAVGNKISYITYSARNYEELQRVLLSLNVTAGGTQTVKLYGLIGQTLPESLTYSNAPAILADGTVDLAAVFGGAPIACFTATEGNIRLDVTEYVRAQGTDDVVFMLLSEDFGDTVHTALDFLTYTFTEGVDYRSDATVSVADGVASIGGNAVTLLNIFGNDSSPIEAEKTYTLTVVAEEGLSLSAAFASEDESVTSALTLVSAAGGSYVFTYTACGADADARLSALVLSSDTEGMAIDAVTLSSDATVVIDSAPELVWDAVKYQGSAYLQANMTLHSSIDFNAYVPVYDALVRINGEDVGAYEVVKIDARDYYKVSFSNLSANGIALTQIITLTVEVADGVYAEAERDVSIGRYAQTLIALGTDDETKALILATVDYLNEASKYFDGNAGNYEIEDVLREHSYVRPEWTTEDKEIVTVPSDLECILAASVSLNNTPGFAVFFDASYTGEVEIFGKTFTAEQFYEGSVGTVEYRYVYVPVAAYAMLDTFTVTVGADTIRYNLDTYISRVDSAKELTSTLYAYASAARAYQISLTD